MIYTIIEDFIKELYECFNIYEPNQLSIDAISHELNLTIVQKRTNLRFDDVIFLSEPTPQLEWETFGHEVCHYLRHHGNQTKMNLDFRNLQEWQADHFAYHFCVPTFMLETYDFPKYKQQAIQQVSQDFNVTPRFARKRLDMYQNKQMQYQYHQKIQHSIVAEKQSVYSTEQMMDMDFNLDHGILPDEVYEHHDLSVDKESKVRKTIQFIKDMRVRGLL